METEDTSARGEFYTLAMNAQDTLNAINSEAKQVRQIVSQAQHHCQQLLWNIECNTDSRQDQLDADNALRQTTLLLAADKVLSAI